jgi:hypothetical protein
MGHFVSPDLVLASAEFKTYVVGRAARPALAAASAGMHLLPGLKVQWVAVVLWTKAEKHALLKVVLTKDCFIFLTMGHRGIPHALFRGNA